MVEQFFKSVPTIHKKKIRPCQIAPELVHSSIVEIPKYLEESLDGGLDSYTGVWCFKPQIHNKFLKYLQKSFPSYSVSEDCMYHFAKAYAPVDSYMLGESNCILLTFHNCTYKLLVLGYDVKFLGIVKESIEKFLNLETNALAEEKPIVLPGEFEFDMNIYEEL